jgi:hypothetical protein
MVQTFIYSVMYGAEVWNEGGQRQDVAVVKLSAAF